MYVPCILAGGMILTWFKSMRTVFGTLKKKKSGQAVKPMTAHQVWTLRCFKFLEAHLIIWTHTRQFGTMVVPTEMEEGGDDDDAASLASACSSSQAPSGTQPSTSQASPSQARDRRPRPATSTSTDKRVDEAILKLAERLNLNTGVQDSLASAVQETPIHT